MLQCVDAASGLGPVLIGHDGVRTACGIAAGGHPVDHRLGQATRSQCRSEEHTSELQSPCNLVCRLLLEKKKHAHITADKLRVLAQTDIRPVLLSHHPVMAHQTVSRSWPPTMPTLQPERGPCDASDYVLH